MQQFFTRGMWCHCGFQASLWLEEGLASWSPQMPPGHDCPPTLEAAPGVSHIKLSGHRAIDRTEKRVHLISSSEMLSFAFSKKEHILMRNQNLVGLKLPELSEAMEQEKGRWGPAEALPRPQLVSFLPDPSVNSRLRIRAFVCPSGECGPYTEQPLSKYLQMNKLIRSCFLPSYRTSKLVSFQPTLL